MAFIDEFSDMLVDSCTYYPYASRNDFGKPTYGTGVVYQCRYSRQFRRVKDMQGDEVVSSAQLWIKGAPIISGLDKFKMSDNTESLVLNFDALQDEKGQSHTKVYLT